MVLAILGVVAGVTVPALRSATPRDDLASSTEAITTLLDRTRRTASTSGIPASVSIDVRSKRYFVALQTDSGERIIASAELGLTTGAELVAKDGSVSFTFEPSGRAFSSELAVRLNGTAVAIAVDPWRGDVRVGTR